jgi:general L-amino acid transport system permease protein
MDTQSNHARPPGSLTSLAWVRHNLFNTWYTSLLTIFSTSIISLGVISILRWVLIYADWTPVFNFPLLYMIGQYPRDQIWRLAITIWVTALMFGISWGVWGDLVRTFAIPIAILLGLMAFFPSHSQSFNLYIRAGLLVNPILVFLGYWLGRKKFIQGKHVVIAWLVLLILTPVLLRGFQGNRLLPSVETTSWGGLMVTLILAIGGITLSFPIGILLALGRRSSLPVVKLFSILFIELVRGVPLVTILFMFSLILTLFLPPESRIDRVMRALMAMTFFSAAYTAENVRGGLQAIPNGQIEAAKAVGLNNFQTLILIILPQALRTVIPAIVGQFISLFKDTTLAIIVGISELLFIGRSIVNSDPEFIHLQFEVYLFVAAIFWIFSYILSSASRKLETTLGVGER